MSRKKQTLRERTQWVDLCEAWLSKRFALTLMDE